MFSKIITVLLTVNAANGFIDSKLQVLEPILKCYEGNAPEFAGMKAKEAHLNLESDAKDLELMCLAVKVSS